LEKQIEKLEKQLESLEKISPEQKSLDINSLDGVGFGIDYDAERKRYQLKVIKYDTNGKDAVVTETKDAGDTGVRAMFEAKKFISHYIDLIVQNN
jgi:hypothetical protein